MTCPGLGLLVVRLNPSRRRRVVVAPGASRLYCESHHQSGGPSPVQESVIITSGTIRTVTAAALASGLLAAGAPAAMAVNTDSVMPPPADCDVDTQRFADETPGPFPGVGWTVGANGNLCGELGYLFLETDGGTGSSPTKVLLFHRGHPVPTQPADDVRVLLGGHSNNHVSLKFQQPLPEDTPIADTSYLTTVYVWNPFAGPGDATPVGPLPPGMDF